MNVAITIIIHMRNFPHQSHMEIGRSLHLHCLVDGNDHSRIVTVDGEPLFAVSFSGLKLEMKQLIRILEKIVRDEVLANGSVVVSEVSVAKQHRRPAQPVPLQIVESHAEKWTNRLCHGICYTLYL